MLSLDTWYGYRRIILTPFIVLCCTVLITVFCNLLFVFRPHWLLAPFLLSICKEICDIALVLFAVDRN